MNTLNREQLHMLQHKKKEYNLINNVLSPMLGITTDELYMASLGRPVAVEVYDAIMEWISE